MCLRGFFQYFLIVRADYCAHVRCTTVADFDSLSIYYFAERVVFGKVFVNQFEEFSADVCF